MGRREYLVRPGRFTSCSRPVFTLRTCTLATPGPGPVSATPPTTADVTRLHGGDPSSTFLSGHGLGAHLALFTLSQEAVVRSRDERELARSQMRHSGRRWREKAMAGQDEVFGWPAMPPPTPTPVPYGGGSGEISGTGSSGGVGEGVPNGLRSLRVYGAEVAIPPVAGVIL